jgi:hypothetical protein
MHLKDQGKYNNFQGWPPIEAPQVLKRIEVKRAQSRLLGRRHALKLFAVPNGIDLQE